MASEKQQQQQTYMAGAATDLTASLLAAWLVAMLRPKKLPRSCPAGVACGAQWQMQTELMRNTNNPTYGKIATSVERVGATGCSVRGVQQQW